jgi:hypothetical protein
MALSHLFRQLNLLRAIVEEGGGNKALKALRLGPGGPLKGPRAQLAIAPIGKIPIFGFRLN